ncbi:unnamed protein product, partial [Iphiclides podalirius]
MRNNLVKPEGPGSHLPVGSTAASVSLTPLVLSRVWFHCYCYARTNICCDAKLDHYAVTRLRLRYIAAMEPQRPGCALKLRKNRAGCAYALCVRAWRVVRARRRAGAARAAARGRPMGAPPACARRRAPLAPQTPLSPPNCATFVHV